MGAPLSSFLPDSSPPFLLLDCLTFSPLSPPPSLTTSSIFVLVQLLPIPPLTFSLFPTFHLFIHLHDLCATYKCLALDTPPSPEPALHRKIRVSMPPINYYR
ncbi:hypothetical protein BOTBODRAFT_213449 [Botryobasidium botryosum FD-172 SS1]|uniref:Uncharacterized protein n=1 Tax=Botryobasidium botryosum (strain FD-172 SS1) TaxID=930990 RepID=A0A067N1D1_BOTB1|nr:hypothetical protein BOTBODRAFT_213449 [Botryobasidium botryosum FD-172 SS1]